jgi:hyperosmotically inducible protein
MHMTKLRHSTALFALVAAAALAGCTGTAAISPDVSERVRASLDEAGLRSVSVSQDRDRGIVTLGGQVADENEKARAESLTSAIAGAQVVANQIGVVPVGVETEAKAINAALDKGIEHNLEAALIANRMHDAVKYSVISRVVTLTGEVASQSAREAAEKAASMVPNVTQVVNTLQVTNQKATSSP